MSSIRMDSQAQLRDRRRAGLGVQCSQNPAGVIAQFRRPSWIVNDDGQPAGFESFGLRVGRNGLTDGFRPTVVEVDRAAPRTESSSDCLE